MATLDKEQVLVESKEYDPKCVQWLSVSKMDLRDISVLAQCPNLIELNVSENKILTLRGLEGMFGRCHHSVLHYYCNYFEKTRYKRVELDDVSVGYARPSEFACFECIKK